MIYLLHHTRDCRLFKRVAGWRCVPNLLHLLLPKLGNISLGRAMAVSLTSPTPVLTPLNLHPRRRQLNTVVEFGLGAFCM